MSKKTRVPPQQHTRADTAAAPNRDQIQRRVGCRTAHSSSGAPGISRTDVVTK